MKYDRWGFSEKTTFPFAAFALGMAAVLTGLRWYFFMVDFVPEENDYVLSSHASLILTILTIVAILGACLVLFQRQYPVEVFRDDEQNASVRAFASVCGICFFAYAIAYNYFQTSTHPILSKVYVVFAVLSVLYFFALVSTKPRIRFRFFSLAGLIVFFILRVFIQHFDISLQIYSPLRITSQMATLAVACYFVAEMRAMVNAEKPQLWYAVNFVAVILLSESSIPVLATALLKKWEFSFVLMEAILELCLLCYIGLRMVLMYFPFKWTQILNYLIFGVLTTVVNFLVFFTLAKTMDALIANVFAWIVGVLFAFITNKFLVFESKSKQIRTLGREFGAFTLARLFSLGAEELILLAGIRLLHMSEGATKLIAAIVVIVLNYVFSKLFIFRTNKRSDINHTTITTPPAP